MAYVGYQWEVDPDTAAADCAARRRHAQRDRLTVRYDWMAVPVFTDRRPPALDRGGTARGRRRLAAAVKAGPGARRGLRDYAGFRKFWTASTVSGFGSYVTALAVRVLVVVTLHGSALQVGLVNAAGWLPYLLFGVLTGVLVDRARRRPLLVVTDLARGVLLLAVPVLAVSHHLQLPVLIVVMVMFGALSLVNDAAFQSFVPRLVPAGLLTPAHARLDQSDAVAQTSGPALAGGLVSLLGAPWAVLVDAASYLVSGVLIARITVVEPPPPPRPVTRGGVRAEAREGLRWVYTHPTLRSFAVGTHAWFVFNGVAGAVLVPFALRTLGLTPGSGWPCPRPGSGACSAASPRRGSGPSSGPAGWSSPAGPPRGSPTSCSRSPPPTGRGGCCSGPGSCCSGSHSARRTPPRWVTARP